jgi:hypothetical protein
MAWYETCLEFSFFISSVWGSEKIDVVLSQSIKKQDEIYTASWNVKSWCFFHDDKASWMSKFEATKKNLQIEKKKLNPSAAWKYYVKSHEVSLPI